MARKNRDSVVADAALKRSNRIGDNWDPVAWGSQDFFHQQQSDGRSVRAAGGSFALTVRRGGDQPREARGSEVSEGYRAIPFKMDATSAHKTTPIAPNSSSCSRSQPMAVPRKHGCPTPQRLATVCSSAFTTRTRRTKLGLRRHRIPALAENQTGSGDVGCGQGVQRTGAVRRAVRKAYATGFN